MGAVLGLEQEGKPPLEDFDPRDDGDRKVIFGPLTKPTLAAIKDLNYREIITLGPLVVLTILFGIYPKPVIDLSAASVAQLLDNYERAIGAAKTAALLAH